MGDIGIIDGQNLQHTLTGLVGPVNHHLQVAEVSYAKAALTT